MKAARLSSYSFPSAVTGRSALPPRPKKGDRIDVKENTVLVTFLSPSPAILVHLDTREGDFPGVPSPGKSSIVQKNSAVARILLVRLTHVGMPQCHAMVADHQLSGESSWLCVKTSDSSPSS